MAGERIDKFSKKPFLDGPAEFLVKSIAEGIAKDPHFNVVFGEAIDFYERVDYSIRELPALRIYEIRGRKEHESHYVTGDFHIDAIFPASLRRNELQLLQDTVTSALIQQFRRPTFFEQMRAEVPGLNEMGKTVDWDKSLGMMLGDVLVPITQLTLNFRIDLKEWDSYLEKEGREKDTPFDVTLEDLKELVTTIQGIRTEQDLSTADVTVPVDENIGG